MRISSVINISYNAELFHFRGKHDDTIIRYYGKHGSASGYSGPCNLNFCAHQKIAFYKWIMVNLYIIPTTDMYQVRRI